MKQSIFFLFIYFFFISTALYAAEKGHHIKTWHVLSPVATADTIPLDTAHVNFQDNNPVDSYSIANSYNGNLLSPIQSKLYFIRPQNSRFIFSDAYAPYIIKPEDVQFYNTKTPYSNIGYNGGIATRYRDEDDVKFLFTANANKRLNFGTYLNYINAVGQYANQNAVKFSGTVFGSYDGVRYSANGGFVFNSIKNYENGGLVNPNDIHNDATPKDLNVNLRLRNSGEIKPTAYGAYSYNAFFFNHHYSLGFNRTVKVTEDSTRTEFVPVTRFTHTLLLKDERKRYREQEADTSFFYKSGPYFSEVNTQDSTTLRSISNTLAVSLEEDFNKWMKFGLSGYIANDVEQYTLPTDSGAWERINRVRTKVGGILSKTKGSHFRYNVQAELDVLGPQAGDFNLEANVGGYFRLWKDSVTLTARGFMRNESPSLFLNRYKSNYFQWNNDFNRTYRTQIGGTIAIPTRSFALNVTVENISNYIYFGNDTLPNQHKGNVQVLAANLKQNFRVGKFHLDNNVVYQLSSDQDILPLPSFTLYHNLYYLDKWFDVLSVQFGVDLRYHTAYYAPSYMPAIGQFYTQDQVKIGNYPVMNVYLNFHLKQVRFFVKYFHFNSLFMDGNYFSMPNYPINPAAFRVGISWNFYN